MAISLLNFPQKILLNYSALCAKILPKSVRARGRVRRCCAGDVCRMISHRIDGCVIDATLIDEDWTSEVGLIKSPARSPAGLEEVCIDSTQLSLV